jgi:hypothetical protein
MAFRMVVRRPGLFDGSPAGRLLENSDTAEVALEFIGILQWSSVPRIVLEAVSIRNVYLLLAFRPARMAHGRRPRG